MTTPARRQYLQIKSQYPDAILMYQVGDFYETFDEDARIAAHELQIFLTKRDYGEEKVPLSGIPLHALENDVGKLKRTITWRRLHQQERRPGWQR